jgi:hypothetical protein
LVALSFTRCPGAPYCGHLARGRLRPPSAHPRRALVDVGATGLAPNLSRPTGDPRRA